MFEAVSEEARLGLRQALLLLLEVPHAAAEAQQAGRNHASNCKGYTDQDFPTLQTLLLSVSPCIWPPSGTIAPLKISRRHGKIVKRQEMCSGCAVSVADISKLHKHLPCFEDAAKSQFLDARVRCSEQVIVLIKAQIHYFGLLTALFLSVA